MPQDSEFHMASAQAFLRQCLQNHPDNYPAVYYNFLIKSMPEYI